MAEDHRRVGEKVVQGILLDGPGLLREIIERTVQELLEAQMTEHMDEATRALDSENEKRIQSAIEELRGHMTILIIAHRLPTVREADVIYVLEQGTVVESGDWNTLAGREDGRFNALCRAQGIRS